MTTCSSKERTALSSTLEIAALVPAIGPLIQSAAVSYDPATMTGRLSSIARYLTVVP